MTDAHTVRPPGRPSGESDARQRLIDAARRLFSRHGFEGVSTRTVANEAGVDAALIRYYFGNKAGLFEQMLLETLAPVRERLRDSRHPPHTSSDTEHEHCQVTERLTALMRSYYQAMAPNPELPRLIQRVLHGDTGSEPYRIVHRLFEGLLAQSHQWIQNMLVQAGHLPADLDPHLVRLSFLSLMVFPLVAPPIVVQASGLALDSAHLERLVQHNVILLKRALQLPDINPGAVQATESTHAHA